MAEALRERGVTVLSARTEPMMTCSACDCPTYAGTHYVEIAAADREIAVEEGFEPAEPPAE